jgi:hypothetical protein
VAEEVYTTHVHAVGVQVNCHVGKFMILRAMACVAPRDTTSSHGPGGKNYAARVQESGAQLYRPSALNYADQNHDDRNHQKNVDKPADGVGSNHSQQPHDQQNYGDSF